MTFAQVSNADDSIIRTFEEADDFTPPAHKFGADFSTRIVPVVEAERPQFNAATHYAAESLAVEQNRVLKFWTVLQNPVPAEVQAWQLKLELAIRGLTENVDAIIAALPPAQRHVATIKWETKPTIRRNDGLTAGVISALGLTPEQGDDIFRAASLHQ